MLEDIEEYLLGENFFPTRSIRFSKKPIFAGTLQVSDLEVKVELHFGRRHLDYPEAFLIEWPFDIELRRRLGFQNINSIGKICYTDESQTWWDSGQAVALTAGVIYKIRKILIEKLSQKEKAEDLIFRDFDGYWEASRLIRLSEISSNHKQYTHIYDGVNGQDWLIPKGIKNSWVPISEENKTLGWDWITVYLKTAPSLKVLTEWPPSDYRQVNEWLLDSNPNFDALLLQAIQKIILNKKKEDKKIKASQQRIGIILSWLDPHGQDKVGCGLLLNLTKDSVKVIFENRTKRLKTLLHSSNPKIERFSVKASDRAYILNRNIPTDGETLKNQKVVLIGAGAIGGFLSELICSMGAGSGQRGRVDIIDFDIFEVENIGRHLLGFDSIGKSKVKELQLHLNRSYPFLNILPHHASLDEHQKLLTTADWVIDATGSQTVSIAISDILSSYNVQPKVIHSWIQGRGIATIAMIRRNSGEACYRCLWVLKNKKYVNRYPLSKNPEEDEPVIVGCHRSFHPYVASTAMQAATQAAQMIQDQLVGRVTNTLCFNVIDNASCQRRPDASPKPSDECPFCSRL